MRTSFAIVSALLLAAGPLAAAPTSAPAFRIYTEHAGVHRLTFEDLVDAGLDVESVPTPLLSLENRGELLPLHLDAGGDGSFGPGDSLEFVAEILSGESTHFNPYARYNVYWLRFDRERARRFPTLDPERVDGETSSPIRARRRVHLEEDRLLIRVPGADIDAGADPELWYWAKQTHAMKEPFVFEIDLSDADPDSMLEFELSLRGISSMPSLASDRSQREHHVLVRPGGGHSKWARWDGKQLHQTSWSSWPADSVGPDGNVRLELTVDRRRSNEELVVDVVMINWARVSYAHNGVIANEQVEIHIPASDSGNTLHLQSATPGAVSVFGSWNGHFAGEWGDEGTLRVPIGTGEKSVWVRPAGSSLRPVAVGLDLPSSLRSYARQADYLMIAHSSLLEASEDLAEFHRERGLSVELIDVQDIYDEFSAGIVSPAAIRDFVAFSFRNWQRPRPRFVLLVGDASWDTKNTTVDDANYANWAGRMLVGGERFRAKETDDYDESRLNNRNLIPTWNYHASEGHAASDAYFTMIDDDDLPDVALGRLPVARPEDVEAITAKILDYVQRAPLGPWRHRIVWISDAIKRHRNRSIDLASRFAGEGLPGTLILPGETATPEDKARIVQALDSGNLVTHFIGHGGRFIWRTGPPDLDNQIDLFDLEDVWSLRTNQAMPIIVSVACYSAPFDHPSADSIGETFLRVPDRGAVAFIGASWRNAPTKALSELLVGNLSKPGTVGEAVLAAKRTLGRPDATHLFNLLGDPAVPLAAPQRIVELRHELAAGALQVGARLPAEAVGGRAVVEYLDASGSPLGREELAVASRDLTLTRPDQPEIEVVTLYFWSEDNRVDGIGAARLNRLSDAPASP